MKNLFAILLTASFFLVNVGNTKAQSLNPEFRKNYSQKMYFDVGSIINYLPNNQTYSLGSTNVYPLSDGSIYLEYMEKSIYPTRYKKYAILDNDFNLIEGPSDLISGDQHTQLVEYYYHDDYLYFSAQHVTGGKDPYKFGKVDINNYESQYIGSKSWFPTNAFSDNRVTKVFHASNNYTYLINSWRYNGWSESKEDLYISKSGDQMQSWSNWIFGGHYGGEGTVRCQNIIEHNNELLLCLQTTWGGEDKIYIVSYDMSSDSFGDFIYIDQGTSSNMMIQQENLTISYIDPDSKVKVKNSNINNYSNWGASSLLDSELTGVIELYSNSRNFGIYQNRNVLLATKQNQQLVYEWTTNGWSFVGESSSTLSDCDYVGGKIIVDNNNELLIVKGYVDSDEKHYNHITHFSSVGSPQITHNKVADASVNEPAEIVANVTDNNDIQSVKLHYRQTGNTSYTVEEMNNTTGNTYTASIPGEFITYENDVAEYYIEACDNNGECNYEGSANNPHKISGVYKWDFEMGKDSWSFKNHENNINPNGNVPTWDHFVEAFGSLQCYKFFKPKKSVQVVQETLQHFWNGSCVGFASSSIINHNSHNEFMDIFPEIGGFDNLYDISTSNQAAIETINVLWLRQFGAINMVNFLYNGDNKTPNETLQELKNAFTNASLNKFLYLWQFDFNSNEIGIPHGVTPYMIKNDFNKDNYEYIYLYDNNYPDNKEVMIKINTQTNQWCRDNGTPDNSHGLFLSSSMNKFKNKPLLLTTLIPFKKNRKSSNSIVLNSGNHDIYITEKFGNKIGYLDGEYINNTSDSHPIMVAGGKGVQQPFGYYMADHDIKVETGNYSADSCIILITDNNAMYKVSMKNPSSSETDLISFDEQLTYTNPDNTEKKVGLSAIIEGNGKNGESEKTFNIDKMNIYGNDSLTIEVLDQNTIELSNPVQNKSSKTYNLHLRVVDQDGERLFTHNDIPINSYSSHIIESEWSDMDSEIDILIDEGIDGTVDDTVKITNETIGYEELYAIDSKLKIYPNPVSDFLTITTLEKNIYINEVVLFSTSGLRVIDNQYNENQNNREIRLNTTKLSKGIYHLLIKTNKGNHSKKVVVTD